MSRRGAILLAATAALLALRTLSAPPWPDDWDGIGFVLSIAKYDLARFAPHPPGYPVYVALLKLAALVVEDPVRAANFVAVGSGVGATLALGAAASRALGPARAAWIAAFVAAAPLVWRAGAAIGSEGPALLFVALALWGASRRDARGAWLAGVALSLGVGVRLSWAPLFVTLFVLVDRRERLRALLGGALATVAWLVPFLVVVGPRTLVALVTTHAAGHFERWGGTALTETSALARVRFLVRDVFDDGLGAGLGPLGVAIALGGASLALLALRERRGHAWSARWPLVALVPLPYLTWIVLGQNLREQPRHALPLVVLVAALFGLASSLSRASQAAGAIVLTLVLTRTAIDARDRRALPPPGAQLAALADALPGTTAVYGGPSARFFDLAPDPDVSASTVGSLGDARLALGRLERFPSRVLVTSELEGVAASPDVHLRAGLCRPPRIDRRSPCLLVYDWRPRF